MGALHGLEFGEHPGAAKHRILELLYGSLHTWRLLPMESTALRRVQISGEQPDRTCSN